MLRPFPLPSTPEDACTDSGPARKDPYAPGIATIVVIPSVIDEAAAVWGLGPKLEEALTVTIACTEIAGEM